MALFTDEEIRRFAFGAVVDEGRKFYTTGKVLRLNFVGDSVIGSVKGDMVHRVVLSREPGGGLRFDCSCGFAYGGACGHVVAVMLGANNHQAIQVGIDWDTPLVQCEPRDAVIPAESTLAADSDQVEPEEEPDDDDMQSTEITELPPGKPIPRLYLAEADSLLLVELRYAYHEGMVEFTKYDSSQTRLVPSEDGRIYQVSRSKARENMLTAGLVRYDLRQYQTGTYTPTGDARMWALHDLPRLASDGFEIFGQENLRSSNARNATPRLALSVKSGEGVFECAVSVSFDGISATLAALIQAVRQRSRFVLLSDGSSGMLPQDWLDRFASLFAVVDADVGAKTITIKASHMALIDMLCGMATHQSGDAEFERKRDALRNFKQVDSQPMPSDFGAQMRPYQLAGYEWFYFLKEYKFGGCLADDMGLGKTVQTLALLLREKQLGERQPSLVIVPTSLLFNWEREAQKFAPSLAILRYHGQARHQYAEMFQMADVVLTSYGTALRDLEMLKTRRFHYIILDEAQAIKNPGSQVSRAIKQLSSDHYLALSGTPIENNLSELWSLFSFINPGMLGTYRSFAHNFVRPIEKELNECAAEVLRKLIFPFMLRRTKEQVAKELPPKNEIVQYADMLPRQKTLYDITRDTYRGKIVDSMNQQGLDRMRFQILEGLLRLRQICCHPLLVDPTFTGDSGKFRMLDECIADIVAEGHRVLVFSQFVRSLLLMRERIAGRGIASELLTGQTRDRQAVVDRFQNKNGAAVFLISLKAGGTGLNLTAADYVIHMDPWWNPSAENQASDRAYRIGQTRTVFVYKMITRGSIEERVLDLQQRKKELVQSVIQTEAAFFKQLSRDDVLSLFS